MLYCSNQCPERLLITVLLCFLWTWHHEYAAAVWFLSRRYSTTYGLPVTHLGYAAQLKQWCHYTAALAYTVLKMNIMNKLKLYGIRFCPAGVTHTAYGLAQEESLS